MKGRTLIARRRSAGCDRQRDASFATNSGKLGESLGEARSVAPDEAPVVNTPLPTVSYPTSSIASRRARNTSAGDGG